MRPLVLAAVLPLASAALTTAALAAVSPSVAAGETCDGRAATIVVPDAGYRTAPVTGTPGDDVIVGTDGADTIDGSGGDDTVCGLGGPDVIRGGAGDDRLFGGLDAAPYVVDDGYYGDHVEPGPGDDLVDLGLDPQVRDLQAVDGIADVDRISFEHSATAVTVDLEAGTATGEGNDTIVVDDAPTGVTGSSHDDTVNGTDQPEHVLAGAGDDTVDTHGGDDQVLADRGEDRPRVALPGTDRVETGDGDDLLLLESGRDNGDTGKGDDDLDVGGRARGAVGRTGAGDDTIDVRVGAEIESNGGQDTWTVSLDRRNGAFSLTGGDDRDRVTVVAGRDFAGKRVAWDNATGKVRSGGRRILRVAGFNVIELDGRVRWSFLGSGGDESVRAYSRSLAVTLRGAGGNDTLRGSARADLLDGGRGRDRLDGRQGRDRCTTGEALVSCEVRR